MFKKLLFTILFLLLIGAAILTVKFIRYKNMINFISVQNPSLENINDGDYNGFFDLELVKAEVNIKIRNKKLTNIKLTKHIHGRGYSAETIIETIINKQSLEVDTISGATASSKAILKAVEDALKKARKY